MDMKKDLIVIGVLVVIILAGAIIFGGYSGGQDALNGIRDMGREEGVVTLALGQSARFGPLTITPLEVVEDSRCAVDMICVWAGTVRVKMRTVSGLGTSEQIVELGKSVTTEAEEVRFVSVSPSRKESQETPEREYRFTLEVKKREAYSPTTPAPVGNCYVGGCSGQICSDEPGAISTCEYRAEYACYKTAKCERQASGRCGWTETSELKMCLDNPPGE